MSGTGSVANPYRVSAEMPCETVRGCFSAGPGIDLDPGTGVIAADLSGQAGNNLTIGPDGGLLVPTSGGAVLTGCGLTGDGSGSAPVTAATGTWPYACDVDTWGGPVVCDSSGVLRSGPRGSAQVLTYIEDRSYASVVIPEGQIQTVDTFSVTVTNPNPCLPCLVIAEQDVDIFTVLPAGAGAATGFDGDETWRMRNTGTGSIIGAHAQATKTLPRGVLAPAASTSVGFGAAVGQGSGGAYFYHISFQLRVLLIGL
ncbi:hypothetical protein ACH437_23580 [Streptomyces xinghaiensis]|uniref:hypothetical protein n=1 Tax=Streptomyces xinghaiensis TaxID=1038928 RepID=UPI0037AEAD7A